MDEEDIHQVINEVVAEMPRTEPRLVPLTRHAQDYTDHLLGIRSWLLSERQVVEVSQECIWRLSDREPEFFRLPTPWVMRRRLASEADEGKRAGAMFQLAPTVVLDNEPKSDGKSAVGPLFVYVESTCRNDGPLSDEAALRARRIWEGGRGLTWSDQIVLPGVRAWVWTRVEPGTEWGLMNLGDWRPVLFKNASGNWRGYIDFGYLDWKAHTGDGSYFAAYHDGERIPSTGPFTGDMGGPLSLDAVCLLNVSINALAALYEEPDTIFMGKRKSKKRRRARASTGGVRGVKRLTLSEDGTRLIRRRWERESGAGPLRIDEGGHNRRSPGEHSVAAHMWRPWVNAHREGENVLEVRVKTREDGSEYTQYKVKRRRKGHERGSGPLLTKQAKMVTGIGDM
jgi:hypothetical protein